MYVRKKVEKEKNPFVGDGLVAVTPTMVGSFPANADVQVNMQRVIVSETAE